MRHFASLFTGEEKGFDEVNWRLLTQPGGNGAGVWTPGCLPPVPQPLKRASEQLVPRVQAVKISGQLLWGVGNWKRRRPAQRPYLDALEKEGVKSLCKEICK